MFMFYMISKKYLKGLRDSWLLFIGYFSACCELTIEVIIIWGLLYGTL